MVRFASLMRSAMRRRRPMTLISVVSAASATARCGVPVRSARRIRPPGPEPTTVARSIPASLARRRLAGEAITRPWRIGAAAGAGGALAGGGGGGRGRGSRCGGWWRSRRRLQGHGRSRRSSCAGFTQFKYDQGGTDGNLVAGRTRHGHHAAAHRRGHFHGRLVGHHLNDELIFGDDIARFGVPGDDFRIHRAFTQIRHLECELAHAVSITLLSAAVTRAWPGKYSHSKA